MGQSVAAIAYGVKMSKRLEEQVFARLRDDLGDWYGLGDDACPNAHDGSRDGFSVLGFVVAIDADKRERPGAVEINGPIPFDDAAARKFVGVRAMRCAERKWAALSLRAKEGGVNLPPPGLILTSTEVA